MTNKEWYLTRIRAMEENLPVSEPALWAIVERLEGIYDKLQQLEEIGDAMGSQRTFGPGGAPVIPPGQPGSEERKSADDIVRSVIGGAMGNAICQKIEGCTLFVGHDGICVVPLRICQCVDPEYDLSGNCAKCKLPQGEWIG